MRGVAQVGAANVTQIGGQPVGNFSLSTAAGWTMLYWFLSVGIILWLFFML